MTEDENHLPPLIDLPVSRSTYCDQDTADRVLAYLWKHEADLVARLAAEERQPFPESRGGLFRKMCWSIGPVLRAAQNSDASLPPSRLALVDLLYELSRRLRRAQGLTDIPVFGKPLAPGPQGPFPPLTDRADLDKNTSHDQALTSELANRICQEVYTQDPALMYEACEQERRLVSSHEIEHDFDARLKEAKARAQVPDVRGFGAELNRRLSEMIEMPSWQEIAKVLND